jgi:M6 family metalloprotease-like protein
LTGVRPLLVVLVDFTDAAPNPARNEAYIRRTVFAPSASVNSMFHSASNGRFYLGNAGVVSIARPGPPGALPSDYYAQISAMTALALRAPGRRRMESFDRNGDHLIDNSELLVLRVTNSPLYRSLGQTRAHRADIGAGYAFNGQTSNVDEEMDMNGMAHELMHALGDPDHIYGPGLALNYRASFMAASFDPDDGVGPIGLDPYERMRSGWLSPRLVAMNSSSSAPLRRYGDSGNEHTLLFYDDTRCASEFFLAEFRNPGRSPIDSGVFGAGIMLWNVRPTSATNFTPFQFNWPPPFTAPFSGGANHAIANFVVGPGGAGSQTNLIWTTPEYQLGWSDGTPTGFGLETFFTPSSDVAYLGWRRLAGRFVAIITAVNGAATRPTLSASTPADFTITGTFPPRQSGVRAELLTLSGRTPLAIISYAPDRIVLRTQRAITPGVYQVHLVRDAPRAILTRGQQLVEFR